MCQVLFTWSVCYYYIQVTEEKWGSQSFSNFSQVQISVSESQNHNQSSYRTHYFNLFTTALSLHMFSCNLHNQQKLDSTGAHWSFIPLYQLTRKINLFEFCSSQTINGIYHLLKGEVGEGNGTLLQYSCLENPMDGGAWRAAVYGVKQSLTWLKWLSSSSSKGEVLVQTDN